LTFPPTSRIKLQLVKPVNYQDNDGLILPLQFRTRPIHDVASIDQVERGVIAQPVAA
jgi:hypothetical protein